MWASSQGCFVPLGALGHLLNIPNWSGVCTYCPPGDPRMGLLWPVSGQPVVGRALPTCTFRKSRGAGAASQEAAGAHSRQWLEILVRPCAM